MGKIQVESCFCGETEIAGLKVITPTVYGDSRGWFMEVYNLTDMTAAGISDAFVQDNQSMSTKGVLRGMHFQKSFPQAKLVRVTRGEVYDVALDMRAGSPSFGMWHGELLSAENRKQFFLPKGFAHGFYVLSDIAEFCYKCTDFYHPDDEGGVIWNDPALGIDWPIQQGSTPIISEKDAGWDTFANTVKR